MFSEGRAGRVAYRVKVFLETWVFFLGVCGEAELFGGWGEGHAGHVPTE